MNGLIAVFNMLPGAPLDGGRVLRAALWRHYRDETRAALAAARAGRYLGILIIGAGVAGLLVWTRLDGVWLMIIGEGRGKGPGGPGPLALVTRV